MTNQILKAVALGILGGLALFTIPFFLLKSVIFILLIRMIFGIFGRRRFGPGVGPGFAFAGGGHMKQHSCGFNRNESLESPDTKNK